MQEFSPTTQRHARATIALSAALIVVNSFNVTVKNLPIAGIDIDLSDHLLPISLVVATAYSTLAFFLGSFYDIANNYQSLSRYRAEEFARTEISKIRDTFESRSRKMFSVHLLPIEYRPLAERIADVCHYSFEIERKELPAIRKRVFQLVLENPTIKKLAPKDQKALLKKIGADVFMWLRSRRGISKFGFPLARVPWLYVSYAIFVHFFPFLISGIALLQAFKLISLKPMIMMMMKLTSV